MRRMTLFFAIGLLALGGLAPAAASSSVVGVIGVSEGGPCSDLEPLAAGDNSPFGFFDGKATDGGNAGGGVIDLQGWALDNDGVRAVIIQVDGIDVDEAIRGRVRFDVTQVFPGFPDSALPGWEYKLDSTRWPNGLHTVAAVVITNSDEVRLLNSRVFEFINLTHTLRPFGGIDSPNNNVDVFGTCNDPLNPEHRLTVIEGWALDVGVENLDEGIGYVELLVDGVIVANTRLNCTNSLFTGGFTNCYGLPRLDIERQYPFALDAPAAGFRFVIDVGSLIDSGRAEGSHLLTVRAGDVDSQVNNIDVVRVNFFCHDPGVNEGSIGEIDELLSRRNGGIINFTGWALDTERVRRVIIHVDGVHVGDATYGFPRPAITSLYPGFPQSAAPGWMFSFDSSGVNLGTGGVSSLATSGALNDGQHQLQVIVQDRQFQETLIGEITFLTSN